MRQRRDAAAAVAALVLASTLRAAEPSPALLDQTSQVILERAPVPSPARAVGEVRLLRRGPAVVVETVLTTTLLRRAVGEIREREARAWPEGTPGHAESQRYLAALEAARRETWVRFRRRRVRQHRHPTLVIAFILAPAEAWIVLSHVDLDATGTPRRTLATLAADRTWVERDMILIMGDSLGIEAERARTLVSPQSAAAE